MQFMIKALDGENKLARRMEVRPRHLEGMEKLRSHIICAGGLMDNEGKMKGSVLILDFPSRDDLDSYTWLRKLQCSSIFPQSFCL